jgi:E3 ubiquitin-protein ligase SHPRH
LYGLLVFLQAEPLDNRKVWLNAIKKPCEMLVPAAVEQYHAFFCRIMWRSARTDVADQLRLPPQHQHSELLEFSDIEAYYYERQHRECLTAANEIMRKYKDSPPHEPIVDKRWVQPFLRLRQACCHHQIGQASKAFLKGKSTAERPLTMTELTDRLLSKAKIEAEEAQRLMLMAINALAALVLLDDARGEEDNRTRAMQLYRDVLQIADEHIERYSFKTDDLQRIHASINLSLLVHRDDPAESTKLRETALELRQNYSKLERSDFKVSKLELAAATQALKDLRPEQHFQPAVEPWWTRAASVVEEGGLAEEFVDRLRRELVDKAGSSSRGVSHSMLQFRDLRGLVYVLRSQLADLWTARKQIETQIRALSEQMSDDDARVAGNCKECRPWGKGPVCAHCKLEKSVIIGYELRLYCLDRDARGATEDAGTDLAVPTVVAGPINPQVARLAWNMKEQSKKNTSLKVSRSPAEPEIALTELLRFISSSAVRDHPDAKGLREAGQAHLNAIGMMKKEFDKLRNVWLSQREVLYRTDELLMSEMRIRIRADGEEVPKEEETYVLRSMEEVRTRTAEFEAEKVAYEREFIEAKSRFSYVRNLKVQQDLAVGDEAMQCPVCHEDMAKGSDIMITPCGHMFCYFCMMKIFERFNSDRISCPMCKKQVHKEDMNHVRERKALPSHSAGRAALSRSAAQASGSDADSETNRSSTTTPSIAHSDSAAAPADGVSAAVASAGADGDSTRAAAVSSEEMRPEMAVKGDFGTKVDALVSPLSNGHQAAQTAQTEHAHWLLTRV